jgi:AraC-like DNA-binding protein
VGGQAVGQFALGTLGQAAQLHIPPPGQLQPAVAQLPRPAGKRDQAVPGQRTARDPDAGQAAILCLVHIDRAWAPVRPGTGGARVDDWQGHRTRLIRHLPRATSYSVATGRPILAAVSSVPPARHLLRAKDLADARYAEPLSVDDLARAAGLSRAHFSQEFRRVFGVTPHGYLLTRRLERAATMLRTTDRSVADICMSVGLQSVGSFTSSFTRTYGRPPTAYRGAFPPAAEYAPIPSCVLRAYGQPQHRPQHRTSRNTERFEKTPPDRRT